MEGVQNPLSPNLWQLPPTEIRIEILKHLPDLPTLHNLLIAYPPDTDLFRSYHVEIFNSIVSKMPFKLQKFVWKIHRDLKYASVPMHIQEKYYRDAIPQGKRSDIDDYFPIDYVSILSKIAEMARGVESLTQSFAKQRILIPSGEPDGQPSPVELHRIRRAFWLFQLLFEVARGREDGSIKGPKGEKRYLCGSLTDRDEPGGQWLHNCRKIIWPLIPPSVCGALSHWETDEFDAVRQYLVDLVNSVQFDRYKDDGRSSSMDPLAEQPVMIQKLIQTLEHWSANSRGVQDHILIVKVGWVRDFSPRAPPRLETLPTANHANLNSRDESFIWWQQRKMGMRQNWGTCMWDRTRLIQSGLLFDGATDNDYWLEKTQKKQRKQLVKTKKAYQRCDKVLETVFDRRVQAQYDADVARMRNAKIQSAELRRRQWLMNWVKSRDAALFEEWHGLLTSGDYDKAAQERGELCYRKAYLLKNLEEQRSHSDEPSNDQSDLELLGCYRTCMFFRFRSTPSLSLIVASGILTIYPDRNAHNIVQKV